MLNINAEAETTGMRPEHGSQDSQVELKPGPYGAGADACGWFSVSLSIALASGHPSSMTRPRRSQTYTLVSACLVTCRPSVRLSKINSTSRFARRVALPPRYALYDA
ncbi:hypothetical protein D9619_008622 [Psilocybe cf. subviscida]|uniref:Uncharacterized protein n=1 Tax=Psilocybe cf. subviscida TaxID=2480587 RepID=A0A8H5F1E2_9AGAR|nr:hypothetical protein D9619_008622 [Psilocybe cf. subviscida]